MNGLTIIPWKTAIIICTYRASGKYVISYEISSALVKKYVRDNGSDRIAIMCVSILEETEQKLGTDSWVNIFVTLYNTKM